MVSTMQPTLLINVHIWAVLTGVFATSEHTSQRPLFVENIVVFVALPKP